MWFWLIPLIPGASALILAVFGRLLPKKYVSWQACLSVLASFVISLISFFGLLRVPAESLPVVKTFFRWIQSGQFSADLSFQLDPLSSIMTLVVTGVGFLIHVYSVGYMAHDSGYKRYFTYLNLFTFAMLILVTASNLVLMFVGWEGVGLCSYLLIGFWFDRHSAANAGKKAFIVNRIGDAAFILGLFFIFLNIGSFDFRAINAAVAGGGVTTAAATLIAILLFAGATGKSAQLPLYVWLPDAMEGPTPVSALIHAATMVTAGVYMVARMNPMFTHSGVAGHLVGLVGALTAVFAATMALTQNDIKRVLAYSTISQIGYMFIGCGVGAYAAGMFHLTTHAFFKSLLFLSAGSVMHALSGELDMRKMGGLRKYLPLTYPVFLVGAIAIAGVPFLSGFFSKDAILTHAFAERQYFIWALGVMGAVLTAFYMFRLIFLTFFGEERLDHHAKEHLHESPPVMTVPLIILAFFSVVAGYAGLPLVFGEKANLFSRFLEPVIHTGHGGGLSINTEWFLILISVAVSLCGIYIAYVFYRKSPQTPHRLVARFPAVYKLLYGKYYVDEIYNAVFVNPMVKGSEVIYQNFDLKVIDGTINGTAGAAGFSGKALAYLQSGEVKDYALAILLGVVIFIGFLVFG
ncbi:MAG: NADH-quinone oxidoreductase subunit L [Candidatus Aminicenantes bacterium RBG_16_63_16]|nr:MAG: NADH-quinone oxidoreductase subunit L [Candidatus Aminicenantes bacterium RBG_16_63_16]